MLLLSLQMAGYGPESQAGEKKVLAGFNSRLEQRIERFGQSYADVKTYLYDSVSHYNEILDNPTAFGFKDATSFGPGADIFWGYVPFHRAGSLSVEADKQPEYSDNYHPSSKSHSRLRFATCTIA